jgi:hypothetical protein
VQAGRGFPIDRLGKGLCRAIAHSRGWNTACLSTLCCPIAMIDALAECAALIPRYAPRKRPEGGEMVEAILTLLVVGCVVYVAFAIIEMIVFLVQAWRGER